MNRTNLVFRAAVAGCLAATVVAVGTPATAAQGRPASVHASKDRVSFSDPHYDAGAKLAVEGTLETVVIDTFGKHGADQRQYGVRTAAGDLIPVPASFGQGAPRGGRFKGELAITRGLATELRGRGVTVRDGYTINDRTAAGQTAAEVASEQPSAMPVANATVEAPAAAPATPAAHHAYVAVINNRGSIDLSSSQIASYVGDVTHYWVTESNGVISSFNTAGTKTYASSVAPGVSSACGMLNPNAVWNEAAGKFPGVNFSSGGNHLMVLVSNECGDAGPAGIGTVGTSIGGGGASMISLSSSRLQVGAHELGHNMSLDHANFQFCPGSCSVAEYMNVDSVMGLAVNNFAPPALDTSYRDLLGVTVSSEMTKVALSDDDTSMTAPEHLSPRSSSSGARGLRITDPLTGSAYYVDYRSGQARDSGAYYASGMAKSGGFGLASGALARYAPGVVISQIYGGTSTKLLSRKSGSSYFSSFGLGDTYTNSSGSVRVKVTSTGGSSGADVSVVLSRRIVSSTPKIAGSIRVGRVVQADSGTWSSGTSLSYAWRANGTPIPDATGSHYSIGTADLGKKLTVVVTGSKPSYSATTRSSASHAVSAGVLDSHEPKISGTLRVGSTLTAVPGTWTTGTVFSYRWYADGHQISSATAQTYTVHPSKKGMRLTVRVRGAKAGYTSAARSSATTAKVA